MPEITIHEGADIAPVHGFPPRYMRVKKPMKVHAQEGKHDHWHFEYLGQTWSVPKYFATELKEAKPINLDNLLDAAAARMHAAWNQDSMGEVEEQIGVLLVLCKWRRNQIKHGQNLKKKPQKP